MPFRMSGNLIVETCLPDLRVLRFVRPDLRPFLNDGPDAVTPLRQEIQDTLLADLPPGWTVLVNLGLVEPFTAAFYRCLLQLRQAVHARQGQLVLCGSSPWVHEIFALFRAPVLFTIVASEAEARRLLRGPGDRSATEPFPQPDPPADLVFHRTAHADNQARAIRPNTKA